DKLYIALEKLGKKHSDLKEKSKFYSMIDQGVCFPFQDVFRDKHPEALYRASNINVSRFTTRFPFSMKLIGYGVNDQDILALLPSIKVVNDCSPVFSQSVFGSVSYAEPPITEAEYQLSLYQYKL
ncbi:unnamed protein product, partial [marine sediment metagenome]